MADDGLFNTTVNLLAKSVDLRARNHNYISANLANAETPGYTPTALKFEKQLQDAVKDRGQAKGRAVTHPRHIPLKGMSENLDSVRGESIETPAGAPGKDGNSVELENEMAKMTQNQIMYNASVQILAKKFEGLKTAIKGQ